MIHPWAGISGILVLLIAALAGLRALRNRGLAQGEHSRKILHTAMGLVTLPFPYLFTEAWPVLLLAAAATLLLLAIRFFAPLRSSLGGVLYDIPRRSLGEICFPLATGLLFYLSGGDALLFGIPMLLLSLADPAAALVGVKYSPPQIGKTEGGKTFAGSLAFLAVAFWCIYLPLAAFAGLAPVTAGIIALTMGLLVMLIEAATSWGLDNATIPLGGYFLLQHLLANERAAPYPLLAGAILLSLLGLFWRRHGQTPPGVVGEAP